MKTKYLPKSLMRPSRRHKRKISLLEIFLMAVETLWSNKIRSGLTMLGVIIGISSVIAITSIGQGVQRATELRIEALCTNILQVSAAAARTGGISQGAGSASTLTWEDARSISKQVPAATAVSAFLYRPNIHVKTQWLGWLQPFNKFISLIIKIGTKLAIHDVLLLIFVDRKSVV